MQVQSKSLGSHSTVSGSAYHDHSASSLSANSSAPLSREGGSLQTLYCKTAQLNFNRVAVRMIRKKNIRDDRKLQDQMRLVSSVSGSVFPPLTPPPPPSPLEGRNVFGELCPWLSLSLCLSPPLSPSLSLPPPPLGRRNALTLSLSLSLSMVLSICLSFTFSPTPLSLPLRSHTLSSLRFSLYSHPSSFCPCTHLYVLSWNYVCTLLDRENFLFRTIAGCKKTHTKMCV